MNINLFKFLQLEHSSNPLLQNNENLEKIMMDVQNYLGPPLNVTALPDGSTIEV